MTKAELDEILKAHKKWLNGDSDGKLAVLRGADLRGADLRGADLRWADLRCANLSEAALSEADLRGAKNVFFPLACPEEGGFIAFKKAANGLIVKLQIPASAKRSSSTTRKCRCNKAIVLSIEYADGTQYKDESVCSVHDKNFVYTVGQEVSVPDYDDDRWNECSRGIHFFITREEAVRYNL